MTVVDDYLRSCWKLERVYSNFFSPSEISSFREMQSVTGAVVSGSTALEFFAREIYGACELQVYSVQEYTPQVFAWLIRIGYTFRSKGGQHPDVVEEFRRRNLRDFSPTVKYSARVVSGVYSFTRGTVRIEVVSVFNTVVDAILRCHTSEYLSLNQYLPTISFLKHSVAGLMNIITHDRAICFYPKSTLLRKTMLQLEIYNASPSWRKTLIASVKEYRRLGWNVLYTTNGFEAVSPVSEFSTRPRHVADELCFVLNFPFDPTNRNPHSSLSTDFCLDTNGWQMTYLHTGQPLLHYEHFSSLWLKNSYCVVNLDAAQSSLLRIIDFVNHHTPNEMSIGEVLYVFCFPMTYR